MSEEKHPLLSVCYSHERHLGEGEKEEFYIKVYPRLMRDYGRYIAQAGGADILWALIGFMGVDHTCWPTIERIAFNAGCGTEKVYKVLRNLERLSLGGKRLLLRKSGAGKFDKERGRWKHNVYILLPLDSEMSEAERNRTDLIYCEPLGGLSIKEIKGVRPSTHVTVKDLGNGGIDPIPSKTDYTPIPSKTDYKEDPDLQENKEYKYPSATLQGQFSFPDKGEVEGVAPTVSLNGKGTKDDPYIIDGRKYHVASVEPDKEEVAARAAAHALKIDEVYRQTVYKYATARVQRIMNDYAWCKANGVSMVLPATKAGTVVGKPILMQPLLEKYLHELYETPDTTWPYKYSLFGLLANASGSASRLFRLISTSFRADMGGDPYAYLRTIVASANEKEKRPAIETFTTRTGEGVKKDAKLEALAKQFPPFAGENYADMFIKTRHRYRVLHGGDPSSIDPALRAEWETKLAAYEKLQVYTGVVGKPTKTYEPYYYEGFDTPSQAA